MIHRHDWGLWEKVAVRFYDDFGDYVYTEHQQQRRCTSCGKYKRKRIR